jgi:dTDP-glucose 4,6-dehydratase
MRRLTHLLVTGGAGFIGSNFIRYLFGRPDFHGTVVNLDKLTYAGNLENLSDIERRHGGSRYFFERADIGDGEAVGRILREYEIDTVVHLAAESHVDRSIYGPQEFIRTNIVGTFTLLEAARSAWKGRGEEVLFHHVSTDEVFGSLGPRGRFTERSAYDPRSPYSASKAASDHLVRAAHHTYRLPVTVSNCSNNYGPYQFPEKLIPLMILNILEDKPLPVYGEGGNVRDWLHVADHAAALWRILQEGRSGATYLIGGQNEWANLELVHLLCERAAALLDRDPETVKRLVTFVADRPGHDLRYAVDCRRIQRELGWRREIEFSAGLDATIRWYMEHRGWVERIQSGEYRGWIERNYAHREVS